MEKLILPFFQSVETNYEGPKFKVGDIGLIFPRRILQIFPKVESDIKFKKLKDDRTPDIEYSNGKYIMTGEYISAGMSENGVYLSINAKIPVSVNFNYSDLGIKKKDIFKKIKTGLNTSRTIFKEDCKDLLFEKIDGIIQIETTDVIDIGYPRYGNPDDGLNCKVKALKLLKTDEKGNELIEMEILKSNMHPMFMFRLFYDKYKDHPLTYSKGLDFIYDNLCYLHTWGKTTIINEEYIVPEKLKLEFDENVANFAKKRLDNPDWLKKFSEKISNETKERYIILNFQHDLKHHISNLTSAGVSSEILANIILILPFLKKIGVKESKKLGNYVIPELAESAFNLIHQKMLELAERHPWTYGEMVKKPDLMGFLKKEEKNKLPINLDNLFKIPGMLSFYVWNYRKYGGFDENTEKSYELYNKKKFPKKELEESVINIIKEEDEKIGKIIKDTQLRYAETPDKKVGTRLWILSDFLSIVRSQKIKDEIKIDIFKFIETELRDIRQKLL